MKGCIHNMRRADHAFADTKDRAWEELAWMMGRKVSMFITLFDSIRMQIGKPWWTRNGQAVKELTEQKWIWDRFQFLLPTLANMTK